MIHEDLPAIEAESAQLAERTSIVSLASVADSTIAGASGQSAAVATEAALPAPPEQAQKRGGGFFAPIRIANFRRLIAGQTISRLGDQFYFIAIPWLVLRTTSNPIALSLVLGFGSITLGLFTLIGGVLADRYGPRALMLGADIARFIIMAVLAALAIFTTPPLWEIATLAALLGVAGGLFFPASGAMTPHLVPSEDLQAANGFEQLTFQSSNFVGPGIAGIILSTTRLTFGFVIDTVSFLASVITLIFIRVPARQQSSQQNTATQAASASGEPQKRQGGLAAFREAISFLRKTPFLSVLFLLSFLGNFAVGGLFEIALPLLFKQRVGVVVGPQALGFAIGGFGLGSIIGAVIAGAANKVRRKAPISMAILLPTIALMYAIPFVPGVYPVAGLLAGVGLFLGISNVLIITVIQTLIPLDMMGRMMSLVMLGSLVGTPLSIFAYGAAATIIPLTWLFVFGASLLFLGVLLGLTQRVMWQSN